MKQQTWEKFESWFKQSIRDDDVGGGVGGLGGGGWSPRNHSGLKDKLEGCVGSRVSGVSLPRVAGAPVTAVAKPVHS